MKRFPHSNPIELTPHEREALILARELVENDKSVFPHICVRLGRITEGRIYLTEAVARLRSYLNVQLLGWSTLESWQDAQDFGYRDSVKDRLAWIDWMLYNTETE